VVAWCAGTPIGLVSEGHLADFLSPIPLGGLMTNNGEPSDGTLVVFQDREWFGDPRLAAFNVTVDGHGKGKARLKSELVVPLPSGTHTVRIRQWWYRSPPLSIELPAGATLRLKADIASSRPLLSRFAKMVFQPGTSLVLERSDNLHR
jgi:hypothetical protein